MLEKFGQRLYCNWTSEDEECSLTGWYYILTEVLPIVSKLSKTFQKSNVNFTCIEPCIEKTIDDLDAALEGEIVNKFEEEFGTKTDERFYEQIHTGFKGKYSWKIYRLNPILSAISVFDPAMMPEKTNPLFQRYGDDKLQTTSMMMKN